MLQQQHCLPGCRDSTRASRREGKNVRRDTPRTAVHHEIALRWRREGDNCEASEPLGHQTFPLQNRWPVRLLERSCERAVSPAGSTQADSIPPAPLKLNRSSELPSCPPAKSRLCRRYRPYTDERNAHVAAASAPLRLRPCLLHLLADTDYGRRESSCLFRERLEPVIANSGSLI